MSLIRKQMVVAQKFTFGNNYNYYYNANKFAFGNKYNDYNNNNTKSILNLSYIQILPE